MTLKDLATNHPYYCNDSNYVDGGATTHWDTMAEFLEFQDDADDDLNLVFRWDVKESDDGSYSAEVFIMLQRKGHFCPHIIKSITEDDVEAFVEYLRPRYAKLQQLWAPLSGIGPTDEET
jgi:hypothetical protein